jgi:hypothetical protein
MKRSAFNLLTALALIAGAIAFLSFNNGADGVLWLLLAVIFVAIAAVQMLRGDRTLIERPQKRLGIRSMRILFWS